MRSIVVGLVLAVAPPTPATIDDYLSSALESTGLPGVSVVVTHGDRIVHATGAGHDSLGNPVTADTPMRVASVSKSFTAAAAMTLVEDGRLSLDEPVAGLPQGVTLRRLLNQTSGIEDSSVDIAGLASTRTLEEYVSVASPMTLASEPGTKWSYSNVNYNVAARLVEEASGQPFDEYMRAAVFEPLGMRDSSVGGWATDGYNSLFGMWLSRPELAGGPTVAGEGRVVTTARDMGRWLIAQTGNGPYSDSMLRTMHEPSTVDEYGMGWAPDESGLLVHSGNLWTYNAIQAIDPKTGYGYAVMTNGAALTDDTGAILAGLVALTRGETPETPGGSRQVIEWVLAAFSLLALALGTLGVVRARRWATRRLAPRKRSTPHLSAEEAPTIQISTPVDPTSARAAGLPSHASRTDTASKTTDGSQLEPALNRKGRPRPGSPRSGPHPVVPAQNAEYDRQRPDENDFAASLIRSPGHPAVPVYREGATGRAKSILPVDNRGGCGQLRIWTVVRLVCGLLPAVLFAFYPQVVSFISGGRTVLWAQLFYFALPLTVTLAVAGVAGFAVFVARVVRLRSVR